VWSVVGTKHGHDADQEAIAVLHAYAAGRIGTRDAIEKLLLRDYADLLIALAKHDLPLPKPLDTPARREHVARASQLLQPRLRRGD